MKCQNNITMKVLDTRKKVDAATAAGWPDVRLGDTIVKSTECSIVKHDPRRHAPLGLRDLAGRKSISV